MTPTPTANQAMRRFLTLWAGQSLSNLGTALTGFALGVWAMQETGSVTKLGLILTAATLPELLILPFAGALVDRLPRGTVMILSDTFAALMTAVVAGLLFTGELEIWMIPLLVAISSVAGGFQATAFQASIRQLLPKELIGRASGLSQVKQGLIVVAAPALAGILLGWIGIAWILVIDLITFAIAACVKLSVRIPALDARGESKSSTLLQEVAEGWRYLGSRRALMKLMLLFGATQFVIAFTTLLYTPLLLSFTTPAMLGVVMSTGALGLLAGGLVVTWRGVPRHKIAWMMGGLFVGGLLVAACGVRPSTVWIMASLAIAMLVVPLSKGAAVVLWQLKVAPEVQGRIFALQRLIARGMSPLAYLSAGPIADRVFEPLLREGGPLADSVGRWIGVGPGRGVALLLIVCGVATSLLAIVGYSDRDIRHVERELPDAPAAGERAPHDTAGAMDAV